MAAFGQNSKASELLSDFATRMGATSKASELFSASLEKEIRNNYGFSNYAIYEAARALLEKQKEQEDKNLKMEEILFFWEKVFSNENFMSTGERGGGLRVSIDRFQRLLKEFFSTEEVLTFFGRLDAKSKSDLLLASSCPRNFLIPFFAKVTRVQLDMAPEIFKSWVKNKEILRKEILDVEYDGEESRALLKSLLEAALFPVRGSDQAQNVLCSIFWTPRRLTSCSVTEGQLALLYQAYGKINGRDQEEKRARELAIPAARGRPEQTPSLALVIAPGEEDLHSLHLLRPNKDKSLLREPEEAQLFLDHVSLEIL